MIEVTNLVGLNDSGLSDPVVYVEILGQVQKTKVAHEVITRSLYAEWLALFNIIN